jgi:hypothetical protein
MEHAYGAPLPIHVVHHVVVAEIDRLERIASLGEDNPVIVGPSRVAQQVLDCSQVIFPWVLHESGHVVHGETEVWPCESGSVGYQCYGTMSHQLLARCSPSTT